uniref:Uncharacterized protein n=1 Tax=Panagrolaimus sp. PS1159 TaxID=55785 RepID=A0AC35F2X0_9BILA
MEIFKALTLHGPLRPENLDRLKDNFIIIAPQMPKAGDLWYKFSKQVHEILQSVQNQYNGDIKRTYLTGFSFGGNGVFDIAVLNPNFFASIWSVDPTRLPTNDPKRPIWLSIGAMARQNTNGFIQKLNLKPANENFTEDRIYFDENADHVGTARLAYGNEKVYNWLLAKKLEF